MRLAAFAGEWLIERRIEDVRGARSGSFTGTACFAPASGGFAYREQGTLRMPGAPEMAAARRYLWAEAGANTIEVRFEDGRLFHRFLADEATPAAVHDCPPDRYRVRYDFRAWPRWRAEWRVVGPRKDYGIASTYRPAGQGGGIAA